MTPQNPARILVVDDDPDTCLNLSDILSDLGFYVDYAHDGPAALKLVDQGRYDVALLDFKMPGMDGVTLYREIKKRRAGTVSLLVTAYAGDATEADGWRYCSFRLGSIVPDESKGWDLAFRRSWPSIKTCRAKRGIWRSRTVGVSAARAPA